MQSKLSKFLAVGLLLGAPLVHAQQQAQWVEGKHYLEIKPAQRPPDAPQGVVEVTEVFSYACVYCNRALPLMDKIKKSLPSNAHMETCSMALSPRSRCRAQSIDIVWAA